MYKVNLKERLDDDQIYVGPSDFIPFLGNTKLMFMRIEGSQWANIPYNMEVRLEVDDKANSAGIVIDAIRLAKIALDRGSWRTNKTCKCIFNETSN